MKIMKKISALVIAMVMVLAMALPAMADATVTINNTAAGSNANLAGHSYKAYKVLNAKWEDGVLMGATNGADITLGDGIDWTTAKDGKTAFQAIAAADTALASVSDVNSLVAALEIVYPENATDEEKASIDSAKKVLAEKVANVLAAYTTGNGVSVTNGGTLADGYWIIIDETQDVGKDGVYNAAMLQVSGDTVNITVKTDKPEITKKIVEGSTLVDTNTASIGQVVYYQLDSKVPDYANYEWYYFVMNDTMSDGLTFNNDIVVKVGTATLVANNDYYVYQNEDGYTFQIAFANIMNYDVGSAIQVNYSATLNKAAVVGDIGNPNTINLRYSNKPDQSGRGDSKPGKPDESTPTGITPDDTVITYTSQLDLEKRGDVVDGELLAGAEFTLTGTAQVPTKTLQDTFTEATDGAYYKLLDGTYTKVDPTDDVKDAEGNVTTKGTKDYYVKNEDGTCPKYNLTKVVATGSETKKITLVGTTDENGKIVFRGLGAGTYTLEETKVPDGYNKAQVLTITISATLEATVSTGKETATWTASAKGEDGKEFTLTGSGTTAAVFETTIIDFKGSTLPSTGGIGTTIFYVIGGILVVLAGIVLVSKRKSAE